MKVSRTTTCGRHDHPEFRVAYDPALVIDADARWFLEGLVGSVAEGARFEPGQTFQVGWIVTEVRRRGDGDLSIWEPDMIHWPVEWSESASHALAHLRVQKDIVESVLGPDELDFPSMRQSTIICNRLGQSTGVVMERAETTETDSGWFCGCRHEDHDHDDPAELRCVSLYEAAVRHAPRIVPYLALPRGVLVGIGEGAPVLFREGGPLGFRAGSYLAVLYEGR